MIKFLMTYLMVTGIGAFVALAMPSLIVIGLFLFILPGLILGAMPALFMYGVVFSVGWLAGRAVFGDGILAIASGIAAILIVAFLVPKPARMRDMAAYRASILTDVTPAGSIELSGDILIRLPTRSLNKNRERTYPYVPGTSGYACDNYCLAALFTPGVTSVTLAKTDGPSPEDRTYRLEKRPACQSNVEVDESALMPPITREGGFGVAGHEAKKVIASQRALLLGGEYCLVMSAAVGEHDYIVTSRVVDGRGAAKWSFAPGRISTQTVEIHEGGRLVYRDHQSSVTTIGVPLAPIPDGGMENMRFGWGRETVHSKKGYGSVSLNRSLADHTNFDRQSEQAAAEARKALVPAYREQLMRALDDPALTENSVEFKVMEAYLMAIGKSPEEADIALVARLFADRRITRYQGAWGLFFTATQMKPAYDAYTERLEQEDFPFGAEKRLVSQAVRNMGPDALGLIGPKQERVLADPRKRVAMPEMARALGFGDAANAPRLLAMLKETAAVVAEIHEQRRTRAIDGYGRQQERDGLLTLLGQIKDGFCLMGPKAAGVRGELDAYLGSGAMPAHLVDGHAMTDWQVILVRMGKPIGSVDKPHNISGTVENYRRNVSAKVERWSAADC